MLAKLFDTDAVLVMSMKEKESPFPTLISALRLFVSRREGEEGSLLLFAATPEPEEEPAAPGSTTLPELV